MQRPKVAVLLSALPNLVGAFLSVEVALTVTNAVVRIQNPDGTPKPELLTDGGSALLLIVLALIAAGEWTQAGEIPFWVKVACATAIALGTYLGGWRIIRTLGKGLVEIAPPQGMAAESAAAAVILSSSHLGFALSTTHVATGSILGSGVGRPGAKVRWAVAGRMVTAWLITLPAASVVGALMWWVADLIGGTAGAVTIFVVLLALSALMWVRSRREPIGHHNVNDEWDAPVPGREPAGAAN